MFSKHLIKMILGLLITGAIGLVSLFLINEYDKANRSGTAAGSLTGYQAESRLPGR
jgi:hypothetical protein